jgi:ornithine carbamoyltransferase
LWADGIEYCGFHQSVVEEMAGPACAGLERLTGRSAPTVVLADLLMMQEFHEKAAA